MKILNTVRELWSYADTYQRITILAILPSPTVWMILGKTTNIPTTTYGIVMLALTSLVIASTLITCWRSWRWRTARQTTIQQRHHEFEELLTKHNLRDQP